MRDLVHELIESQAELTPAATAIMQNDRSLSYAALAGEVRNFASALITLALQPGDRVAVYLPKLPETVIALFGAAAAGGCFVPVNPVLKPSQVRHILDDAGARILVTSAARWAGLRETAATEALRHVVLIDEAPTERAESDAGRSKSPEKHSWRALCSGTRQAIHRRIDSDMAAILYTSGSSGLPKGVVLSHRNLVAGASSVASYLKHEADDRLLALLPLSFDAGLSQLTTAFIAGASVVLHDYLLPQDALRSLNRYRVTGLTAVPTLWLQLLKQQWTEDTETTLRYIANTGGALPVWAARELSSRLPDTEIYLMYGLTEAFRSTYLPPEEVQSRPDSIGKAIPNAEILVVNERGELCDDNEPGELVHRGALVAMGYWNDPSRTAERFRPCPTRHAGLPQPEIAVWSGDRVVRDQCGFLYFQGRGDAMIKTSGYRVSPTEIESAAHASGWVQDAVALGVPHARLGQGIILLVVSQEQIQDLSHLVTAVEKCLRIELPAFMQPAAIIPLPALPTNPNGKVDRQALALTYQTYFEDSRHAE